MGNRNLPKHVYRDKGRLVYKRRAGSGWVRHVLRTWFDEGQPIPDTLARELELIAAGDWGKDARKAIVKDRQDFFLRLVRGAKSRANAAGRSFDLPQSWARDRFFAQGQKCAATGLPIRTPLHKHDPWMASIDRVDNSRGYTPDNCRLVAYIYNCARNQFTQDDLLTMCEALTGRERTGNVPRHPERMRR